MKAAHLYAVLTAIHRYIRRDTVSCQQLGDRMCGKSVPRQKSKSGTQEFRHASTHWAFFFLHHNHDALQLYHSSSFSLFSSKISICPFVNYRLPILQVLMPQQHARNWEEPFTEDCPTVSPTPIQERTSEEMNRSLFLSTGAQPGAASSATTPGVDEHPNRVFKGVLDESKFTEKSSSLPSKASHNNGEAKGRALANSTRTDTTRVYEGEGTAESPFIVDWSDNDPQNPMRWVCALFLVAISRSASVSC